MASHQSNPNRPLRRHALAQAALLLAAGQAAAQSGAAGVEAQTVTVSGKSSANAAGVAGFGDVPLWRAPFSATVINVGQLQDAGIAGLGDLTRLDAGITDAYNPPGYFSQLSVRGFTLDNRFNYRRDGLPINAETVIGQANKQALEILKGTSGLQSGTSAPGGLVNLVVKRPAGRIRSAALGWEQNGTVTSAVDLGDRVGDDGRLGWRINASADKLDPTTRSSRGQRWLVAAAADARLAPGTLVEVEFEQSRQSQPSTPGFSLLGSRLPDAAGVDPRLNLNNQAWTLPVVLAGRTGSLRLTQALGERVDLVVHVMRQRLDSDDRIAFPFGCSAENNYSRYCSDGSFDFYDFRSDGERRTSDAADIALRGRVQWLGLSHDLNAGLLATRLDARFNGQTYNWVGVGTVDGRSVVLADPSPNYPNTNRHARSTEWHLQDSVALDARWQLWAGLRHTRLQRGSVGTDGSDPVDYRQSFTTPWLALGRATGTGGLVYASWGQGIESEVVPNLPAVYRNAGQALPALKSRQVEAGYKQHADALDWTVAAFDIVRPATGDAAGIRVIDGSARHSGLEADAEWRAGALSLRGSAMLLRARREGAADPAINGLRPTNVPARSLKLQAAYNLTAMPGLALLAFASHEGQRMVLPDNSLATPGWTRLDLGARYTQRLGGHRLTWRTGVDNVVNRRAWKEAPFQYDHAYLYPLAPRTAHASVQVAF